jgi:long-chain fatty acid transport protein
MLFALHDILRFEVDLESVNICAVLKYTKIRPPSITFRSQETSMSYKLVRVALLSAICSTAIAGSANAAGFYIQEQSVRGLGSAFSGSTTTLDDASTIYFNPAGMTKLEGLQMQGGVNLLIPNSKVKNNGSTAVPGSLGVGGPSGNPYDPTPVPNGFVSYQVSEQFWAGIGVTAPFGLASDYGDNWFGRFDSTKTELAVIDIQPTIAYKFSDWLSVGAGANIAHSEADLRNRVLLGAGQEGYSKLQGEDWGFGYSLGLQVKPLPTTTIGLSYKSEAHHNLDGRIVIAPPANATVAAITAARNNTSDGSAKLTTPDHATFGIAHDVNDQLTLQAQATWFGWNNFDAITAFRDSGAQASSVQQGYQTTWAFAAGAEYKVNDTWRVRGGIQFDETPTTDAFRTSRTPDGDRTWVSLGATYSLNNKIDLDLAATYIDVEDGTINVARSGGQFRAKTSGDVGILAVGVSYKF